jgi:hypothetical protein
MAILMPHKTEEDTPAKLGSASWYLEWFSNHTQKLYNTTKKKNADYSTGGDLSASAFTNFEFCEKVSMGKLSTVHGFVFRLSDKFTRLINLLTSDSGPAVEDERVEDTIDDAIVYLFLLRAYLKYDEERRLRRPLKVSSVEDKGTKEPHPYLDPRPTRMDNGRSETRPVSQANRNR